LLSITSFIPCSDSNPSVCIFLPLYFLYYFLSPMGILEMNNIYLQDWVYVILNTITYFIIGSVFDWTAGKIKSKLKS